jgi:hypothetical protein
MTRQRDMLRLENVEDFVEVGLVSQETDDLPSRGDVYVTIRISSAGFTGHNDLWVLASVFRCFCKSLVELERDRRGEAVLESISPNELRLLVRSVDSSGYVAVEGFPGYEVLRDHSHYWHSVNFGFGFDPSQLVRTVSLGWVKRNAKQCDSAPPR